MREFECSSNDILEFIELAKRFSGNDLISKKDIVKNKIASFAKNKNIDSMKDICSKFQFDRALRQEILNLITINETYFMRELNQLNSAIQYANNISIGTNSVKILCAPCSSGEEVYSLGILSKIIGIDRYKLKIIGIDINSQMIQKCKEGVYNERSVKNLRQSQKEIYFKKYENEYQIKQDLMPMIEFKTINIFDDSLFSLGQFDVILSRNMMIYFDENYRLLTIERFAKILKPYGRIYFGNADLVPYCDLYNKVVDLSSTYYERV
ncbi:MULTISPECIES: CheR family methyltransferase [Campylobacter]|uniref:CheR family methyltransferase n=1 Tax=Campylobacter porcelli TaxID=1660073 RepID=A0A1X9SWA8_9BACT|nr:MULTISPECIES: CheR family methyltransferase [unclassified Campylobacter]MCR8678575.1 protein-glutamate O-methyltransferase CheR [Campylobacter sp. RM19072]MCR8696408.1 protein-glutamate O-methyltransferase CheR [Campylobacter sp. RM19073]MEE3704071.1 CheR family methyltransferase [Campylobacter sp. CX2-8023-23]MEE3743718.1 CheR family methyltransferase [Campylobacter sp. CX2-4855-23]MEE3775977.1 CheR family methyltransferase [Campylobacter sp. CX2-4080-23]